MPKIKCRTAYSARDVVFPGLLFADDEGLTQQHFKDECDINQIVKRYVQTGVWDHESDFVPYYGDVSEVPNDLMSSFEEVARAEAAFMDLPSDVRKALDNDPSRLGAWLHDPANRDQAIRAGLIVAPQETVVVKNDDVKATESQPDEVSE